MTVMFSVVDTGRMLAAAELAKLETYVRLLENKQIAIVTVNSALAAMTTSVYNLYDVSLDLRLDLGSQLVYSNNNGIKHQNRQYDPKTERLNEIIRLLTDPADIARHYAYANTFTILTAVISVADNLAESLT